MIWVWLGWTFTLIAAAFLGAILAIWLAGPMQDQPRHPANPDTPQRFPLNDADGKHRGTADHPRHVKPDEGEL